MKFQSAHPELAFYALLAIGTIEFILGQLPITKRRRTAFVMLSVIGAVLMIAAVPFRYSGYNNALLWLVGAEAFLIAGIILKEKVFRRLGLLTGIIAACPLTWQEITTKAFLNLRWQTGSVLVSYGVLFMTLGIVYYLNSQFMRNRWGEDFDESFESGSMVLHSYLGMFAMALGAWALLPGDWTVLGWAALFVALAYGCGSLLSEHLLLQSVVIGIAMIARAIAINLKPETSHSHRLFTILPLAAAYYISARFVSELDSEIQKLVRNLFAAAGTALMTLLIWREFNDPWITLAWAGFALLLVEAARALKNRALFWHVHALMVLAFIRLFAVSVSSAGNHWHGLSYRLIAMLLLAVVTYVLASRVRTELQSRFAGISAIYTWAAAIIVGCLLWYEVPSNWIAVSWMAFGLALTFIGRTLKRSNLCYQENVLAIAAIIALINFNFGLEKTYAHFTLRLITVALVAAGLYVASRKSSLPESMQWRPVAYMHTWAATGLLSALAYFELHHSAAWLPVVWVTFALVLTIIDRRFRLSDLRWQSHVLALITAVRTVGFNLHDTSTLAGLSLRLISVSFVALAFYALSRIMRMPEEYRRRDIQHIYSWTASALVATLMWYELRPQAVAIGWGLFGLLLIETGLLRKIPQFRFQGYVALASAFVRIFFSNLAENKAATDVISPRILTVIPLAIIIYWVYSQLEHHKAELIESRFKIGPLFCYAGTVTISALLYFELQSRADWIATAWSGLVLVLFVVAIGLHRAIFVHQALILTFTAFLRGALHNLFGGSYFNGTDWTGRFVVLGSAIAVMLLTLPLAFKLRNAFPTKPDAGKLKRFLMAIAARPEQMMFFAPFLLLTLMLALKMRAGMVTVSWGIEALLVFILAFSVREYSYRITGMILVLICAGKIAVIDFWRFQLRDRYITCIILGVSLLVVHFLYSKHRETLRKLL